MGSLNQMLGGLIHSLTGKSTRPTSSTAGPEGNTLLNLAMELIQKHGGIGGLLESLKKGGLGKEVESWIGTGRNASISKEQLSRTFGQDELNALAAKAGVSPEKAGEGLAKMLPELVNKLTPDGKMPENIDDMLKSTISSFFK